MLRRETGQILPGLIMLMLAILALGMLSFTIGKAAVLRSGAQTAADAAALAGARSIRDQLIAQVATTGTSDFARVSYPIVRAAAADYAKRNEGRLTDLKMEGADVRAYVTTDDEDRPAEGGPRGQGDRAGARRARGLHGRPSACPGARRSGRPAATRASPARSGRSSARRSTSRRAATTC